MMNAPTLKHTPDASSLPAKEEAIAVLIEMERLAEQRLIEASYEFQDIAHEMEWRLLDWTRLCDERVKLEKQLERAERATPRFNLRARDLRNKDEHTSGRKDKWSTMVALLCERLERNVAASEETLDAITSRNDEGEILQREIFELQEKIKRISQNLRPMEKPPAFVVCEGDAVEAFTRMSASLGNAAEDLPDPATLISAAFVIGRGVVEIENERED